ncbi:helix-turn-helix domain-containing protein [Pseudonocardia sp. ICBG601]|uniref:helix-turn-helix domain-containing protein n=1 Tax=Pseudonocardia sp. ICBG601 TaxID=2846759 RepID=UPI0035AC05AB
MRKLLTLADREEISRGLAAGRRLCDIAAVVGRDRSVISREVARHGGRAGYRAGPTESVFGNGGCVGMVDTAGVLHRGRHAGTTAPVPLGHQ